MSPVGRDNKDVWAGAMFVAIGGGAMLVARDYPFGSALRMGPGFFPTLLGGILVLFGLYVLARGLRRPERIEARWSLRALVMLPLSLVLFGILMERAGFVPAIVVLAFGSAAAGREFKFAEVLLLTLVLTGLSVGIFIWGLGLPYPLLKGF
jgi:putative tricarboxylic transport membrane protein